ncbi:uncharacterized protein V1518DRAFT_331286 [Limtongia smithiae]|uniref:uncharacterized protein n=1 Tax=Limtongia smithiae TaxID=1125753 RepID=UPI0034CF741E
MRCAPEASCDGRSSNVAGLPLHHAFHEYRQHQHGASLHDPFSQRALRVVKFFLMPSQRLAPPSSAFRRVLLILAGSLVACPLLYCAYFDYRRRHSRSFRRTIRSTARRHARAELRKLQRRYTGLLEARLARIYTDVPTMTPPLATERRARKQRQRLIFQQGSPVATQFILASIASAEEHCTHGRYEDAALDYYMALCVYPTPEDLLSSAVQDDNVDRILRQLIQIRPLDWQD